jgi:hypothetical protein
LNNSEEAARERRSGGWREIEARREKAALKASLADVWGGAAIRNRALPDIQLPSEGRSAAEAGMPGGRMAPIPSVDREFHLGDNKRLACRRRLKRRLAGFVALGAAGGK